MILSLILYLFRRLLITKKTKMPIKTTASTPPSTDSAIVTLLSSASFLLFSCPDVLCSVGDAVDGAVG